MYLPAHQVPAEDSPGIHQTNVRVKLKEKYKVKMQNQTRHFRLLRSEITDIFIGHIKQKEQGGEILQT